MTTIPSRALAVLCAILVITTASGVQAEEPQFLAASFPDGYTRSEDVRYYNPGNLYEYINGQAVFYLSYKFTRLEHSVYKKGEDDYTVDIYELGSPLSAFGAFRQQRDMDAEDLGYGVEGAVIDYLTTFYAGKYYVEIIPRTTAAEKVDVMRGLAGHVAGAIGAPATLPAELAIFPKSGLVGNTERYVDENLLSYAFMGRGLTADYNQSGADRAMRVFISFAEDKAGDVYTEFSGKLNEAKSIDIGGEKGVTGDTPYRGTGIAVRWKGYVIGALSVDNKQAAVTVLTQVLANVKKNGK